MKKEAMKFTDSAVELFKEVYDISGGAVVVTELPEVGEEYTIYELRESKVVQSLVPMFNQQMRNDHLLGDIDDCFVFNTSEEMQDTFNSIVPEEESGDIYLNYITEEDKLIGAVYQKSTWKFTEARKISDCKFSVGSIFELEDDAYEVILKEYIGEVQGTTGYRAVLFNGEPYVFEPKTTGILLGTPTIGSMIRCNCSGELPEIPEDVPSEYVFENIPYEKIINYQLLPHNIWYFTPKGGEVTVISYWIYSNGAWVNMDELPDPNLIKIGITCTNGTYRVRPIPLDDLRVIYDGVAYKITQYAETVYEGEDVNTTTYYGYIEVPMSTQENLTHIINVVTAGPTLLTNWFFGLNSETRGLNSDNPISTDGIWSIVVYYQYTA